MRGLTITEVVVAFAVLTAALAPLFMMQSSSVGQVKTSVESLYATALSSEIAEQLRTLPFGSLPIAAPLTFKMGPKGPASPILLPASPPIPLALGQYPLETTVTILVEPLDPPDVLARLTITVGWLQGATPTPQELRHVEIIENTTGVVDNE